MLDWFAERFRVFVVFGFVLAVIGSRMAYEEYRTEIFKVTDQAILAEPYEDGLARLAYTRSFQVTKSCPYEIRRSIIDSQDFRHTLVAEVRASPQRVGHTKSVRRVDVPDYLPDGPAKFVSTVYPKCGWIQKLLKPQEPLPELHFMVRRVG